MFEVTREAVIRRMLAGTLAVGDAALLLGISEAGLALRARFVGAGTALLQLPPRGARGTWAHERIELR